MNYYQVLNLPKSATYEQIKNKYLELSTKYKFTDINKYNLITKAYKTLADPYSRGQYDYQLSLFNPILNFPRIKYLPNNPPTKSNFYSYSSSSISNREPNGQINTRESININNNGQEKKYFNQYYIDQNGTKHIIKQIPTYNKYKLTRN